MKKVTSNTNIKDQHDDDISSQNRNSLSIYLQKPKLFSVAV